MEVFLPIKKKKIKRNGKEVKKQRHQIVRVVFYKNRKMFILLQDNLLLEWIINLLMIKS